MQSVRPTYGQLLSIPRATNNLLKVHVKISDDNSILSPFLFFRPLQFVTRPISNMAVPFLAGAAAFIGTVEYILFISIPRNTASHSFRQRTQSAHMCQEEESVIWDIDDVTDLWCPLHPVVRWSSLGVLPIRRFASLT
ncbi:hypothetical protein PRIPAC_76652 [Pristionchus pacificus]|uniref:Uncharacterized protein n=1 Tax=Pristionchus pacificus TaxID=54126 RepID=A0A8R1Z1X2_PRIPA|nr:hypothetical protein PRIPAC_76652 [Pristionchus pacificus]|eukprot:PDM71784.1 hypothetical protein PRIPAC_38191 [Pristionchus pacificus]